MAGDFDYDWLVIGSGFGGSVSALRLSEKGYKVGVLECGRRFADHEFPESTSDYKRYFWRPKIGWKGIFRLTTFKDVSVVSGCGVGGGSLGYANTLYVPPKPFFEDAQWSEIADWETELAPHYEEAQRMLGVTMNPYDDPADTLLRELGEELGVSDTYKKTPVGVYLRRARKDGERRERRPGEATRDPYFDGEGPDRTRCALCGRCMVGCPHGSKNTLVKNYLYLAEKRGAKVSPERTVIDIRPLGVGDGSEGYEVESDALGGMGARASARCTGLAAWSCRPAPSARTRCCSAAASVAPCPRVSARLGELVRTNSEAILAVTVPEDYPENLIKRVAITSSIYPDPHTHIETVTYGDDGDSMSRLNTLLTGDGTRFTRPLKLLGQIIRHPKRFAQVCAPQELVAAHDHHPRDANAGQRDGAAPQTGTVQNAVAEHRTGP